MGTERGTRRDALRRATGPGREQLQVELLEQLVAEQQHANELLEYLCQVAHTNNPRGITETRG